jgi:hypothetical protein
MEKQVIASCPAWSRLDMAFSHREARKIKRLL